MSAKGTGKPLSECYIKLDNGCWLWTKGKSGNYGVCRYKGRVTKAHIAVYIEHKGNYESTLELDHKCRMTLCVNPEHLEPVSHKVNVLRGTSLQADNAKKTHCPRNHEYSVENTFRRRDGRRECKECMRLRRGLRYIQTGR